MPAPHAAATEHPRNAARWPRAGAVVMAVGLAGCAVSPGRPLFVESPTPLVAGATLVAPIDRAGAAWADGKPSEPAPLVLGDGQRIPTSIATLTLDLPVEGERTWLPDTGRPRSVVPTADGFASVLVADIPLSGLGQSVWMAGRRVPAFWLMPEADPPAPTPTSPALTSEAIERAREALAPELADPALRWRAALALERLGLESPPAMNADPIVTAWAAQCEARWRAAERRLREADAALADRLVGVLTRWLLADGQALPVWPTSGEEINDLVLAILRPGANDDAIRRSVQAFLERQPQWMTWVADDAGGIVGGSVAAVNLSPQPALLSLRAPGGLWQAHGMLEPDQLAMVNIPSNPAATAGPAVWELRLGGRSRSLAIATDAIDLQPPGMPVGPFWNDWTLEGLTTGTGQSPTPGQSGWVGGLIHEDPRLDIPPGTSSGWAIYIEVRRPPCRLPRPGERAPEIDAVRLAFGPTARPRAEVTVRCTGLTTFDAGSPGAESALLTTASDRWAFTLPIDAAWLEPDGTFLVGAQFLPHEGGRASWPRPVLPGQETVGRVRIDPSAWRPGWSPSGPAPAASDRSPGAG